MMRPVRDAAPADPVRLAAVALVAAALGVGSAGAQTSSEPPPTSLERLLDDLLRPGGQVDELTAEARRALEALRRGAAPWADALGAVIADPDAYETPVTLPNGDILIRRRKPPKGGPADPPPTSPDAGPPIEL